MCGCPVGSHLPAGRLQVDSASSVGHCALHPHEEVSLCVQLLALFGKSTACQHNQKHIHLLRLIQSTKQIYLLRSFYSHINNH